MQYSMLIVFSGFIYGFIPFLLNDYISYITLIMMIIFCEVCGAFKDNVCIEIKKYKNEN
jgi:hypothetical protein